MAKPPLNDHPVFSKPKKYTQAQIDSMDTDAQSKIDAMNQDSTKKTEAKVDRASWAKKYQRGLV